MRAVRTSKTFDRQLVDLLDYGEPLFGEAVIADKRRTVYRTLALIAHYPALKAPNPHHGLRVYAIRRTPFLVLYEFDDDELRIHFIFHRHADLSELDPSAADWS